MKKVGKREGLVCICAECNKVIKLVGDVKDQAHALKSHGICPECAKKLYGELFAKASETLP